MWKKNLDVCAQKEYYDFTKKSAFKIILGIILVIVLWFLFQTLPIFISKFFSRDISLNDNIGLILAAAGNFLAAFAIWFFFMRKEKKFCPAVTKKMTKIQCLSGAFFSLALSGIISVIVDVIKYYTGLIQTDAAVSNIMSASLPIQILMSVISAAVAEEILLRGCIQNRLMGCINNVWALILTAAIFGLTHGNVSQFITASVTGLAFCFVYAKSRSLWAAIIAHMINNLSACLQSDFLNATPGDATFWIFNAVVIIGSIILAIPFVKADAAVMEKNVP